MLSGYEQWIEAAGRLIDIIGVAVILGGTVLVTALAVRRVLRHEVGIYGRFRRELGRAILVGLELLVAADIIRTVAIEPTLESVAVLAGIVLVRTFLSFSLEVEVTGRWPWQPDRGRADSTADGRAP